MGALCAKESEEDEDGGSSSLEKKESKPESTVSPSTQLPQLQFDDTTIKPIVQVQSTRSEAKFDDKPFSLSRFSSLRDSYRRPTLTYTPSLAQTVKFNIGNELLCMSWNLHHESEGTPFDFYCDFRSLGLKEYDTVLIEIIWDVARVLLYTDMPTELCKQTLLSSCVPPSLLTSEARSKFCNAAKVSDDEIAQVMAYPSTTIHDFLLVHSRKGDGNTAFGNDLSFIGLHQKSTERETSPLRMYYDDGVYKQQLGKDPTLLPLLVLDSLHVLVIRLSVFLIENQLRMAFSEYTPDAQTERLADFLKQNRVDDLSLPKRFVDARKRLYKKWSTVFQDSNKIQQLWTKASQTQTDIILLQQLTKPAFKELTNKLEEEWVIVPAKFPMSEKETTAICLRKTTVTLEKDPKIRRLNAQNFAVLCKSSDILFYVAVVHLTEGEGSGQLRKKEALQYQRILGKSTPTILGGEFNEDLTAYENPVAQIMLRAYNGIDHTQEEPLAFSINRTRTNLQCAVSKADKLDKGVDDGIFSSFPLVGEAFTDFLHSGLKNPSDHGPVFQRLLLGLF